MGYSESVESGLKQQRTSSICKWKILAFITGLLLILPSLILLYFIQFFGVNVIFWDEWEVVPFIQKMMAGNLHFYDLLAQHNEHRIPFARIMMLLLGEITSYNTIIWSYFNWILLCSSSILIFVIYLKKLSNNPKVSMAKKFLTFLPVMFLLFSFRNHTILLGFTCHIQLMVLGAVATFFFLELSKKIDFWFMSSLGSAILASFSFITGLLVWPIGLMFLLISDRTKRLVKKVVWGILGITIIAIYLYGFQASKYSVFENILKSPVDLVSYFTSLIGAPFSYNAFTALIFGFVLIIVYVYVIIRVYRHDLLRQNMIWLSFIIFSLISLLSITIGRAGHISALTSWYTPISVIGIIGLYLIVVSFSKRHSRFKVHVIILFLVGMLLSFVSNYLIWPVGFLQLVRRFFRKRMIFYSLISFIAVVTYLYHYILYSGFPSYFRLTSFFIDPLNASKYFIEQMIDYFFLIPVIAIASIAVLTGIFIFTIVQGNRTNPALNVLLTLILIGLISSYSIGVHAGQDYSQDRKIGAYVLTTYPFQSDENIRIYLYDSPQYRDTARVVRERAEFLKQNKFNVFREGEINPSTLTVKSSITFYSIDSINDMPISQGTPVPINRYQNETITIKGWAVDLDSNNPAKAVFITIDEKIDIPAFYGLKREDVSILLNNPNYRFSGFIAMFSSSLIKSGTHNISIKIVTTDGDSFYFPDERVTIKII